MAENYVVNYDINVKAQDAIAALQSFQNTTAKLTTAASELDAFKKKLAEVTGQLKAMGKKAPVLDVSTQKVHQKLDRVVAKLEKIQKLARQPMVLGETVATGSTSGTKGGAKSGKATPAPTPTPSRPKPSKPAPSPRKATVPRRSIIPNNIGYRVLGPTPVDSISGALDLVKGMGIAYGISGLGSLFGNVLSSATEYDNVMQTAKNILGTHDKAANFDGRFSQMAQTIRNVGVETKFTAPQVADASKFLAMAGMDINAINSSIRPIADIALVGDTDLGATADVVTNIMTGYKISPDKVRHAADVMTMTFTKSNTTLMEMAEAYKYSASLLSAGGISFEESSGGLGILGDAGIKGSQAGTTLRTIMSNLVNPTGKQLDQWNALGIERFDADGKLRSLVDIFRDLSNADLYVDDFYKLFHKTAAQGAVALTQGVEKWNEIVEQNFLSDGLSSKLAEAKKNTVQGLWAQLTSMFTENGMKAFEGLQAPIVNLLQQVIGWLKTPEAVAAIKDISKALMELIKYLWSFTKVLLDLYKRFKGWIELWIGLQLALTAIITPLRVFKSLIEFGGGAIKSVRGIVALTSSFGDLFSVLRVGRSQLTGTAQALNNVVAQTDGTVRIGKLRRLSASRNAASGVGGMIGAGVGAYLGAGLGDPGSWQSTLGSAALTVGGGVLGSQLLKGAATLFGGASIKGVLPALVSNPVGWGAMILTALGAATYGFIKYRQHVNDCTLANNEFFKSAQSINGINYSEGASMADQYLSIVYNKQLDANGALAEHIRLMKEELGLMSDKREFEGKSFKETNHELFVNTRDGSAQNMLVAFQQAGGPLSRKTNLYDGSDQFLQALALPFDRYTLAGVSGLTEEQAKWGAMSYTLGLKAAEPIIADIEAQVRRAASTGDIEAIRSQTLNAVEESKKQIIGGSPYWSKGEFNDDKIDTRNSYYQITAQNKSVLDAVNYLNPQGNKRAESFSQWHNILTLKENGQTISESIKKNYLLSAGHFMFDTEKFGQFGSAEWLRKFGYYDGAWHEGTFKGINPENGKDGTWSLTAAQTQQSFNLLVQRLIGFVNSMDTTMQPVFSSITNNPIFDLGKFTPKKEMLQRKEGTKGMYKGKAVVWMTKPPLNEPMWWSEDGSAHFTDEEMKESKKVNNTNPNANDYKSQYSSSSAAPKQVIVKIENLMNVENVDLANPDNAAAIADIKTQLTQALVDVVHDFDETYHG